MKNKTLGLLFAIFISLAAIMWSPWISEDIAKKRVVSYFEESWEPVSDGCHLKCENCGVIGAKKVLFGQLVSLRYKCGWAGDVITDKTNDIFINFLGRTNYNIDRDL